MSLVGVLGASAHRSRPLRAALAALTLATAVSACGSAASSQHSGAQGDSTVNVALTPAGCAPKPDTVQAGQVSVNVANKDASSVFEAELRTSDLSHILGEQENLTPGISGGFSLYLQPGRYIFNCPGASQDHWPFTVKGKTKGQNWSKSPVLVNAVQAYTRYVDQNALQLVNYSKKICTAIRSGDLTAAELAYPRARVYYEHIEPVAQIWGTLDINIDGRWENPVTIPSQFIGFHKIEQRMWEDDTLSGTPKLCAGLVQHEQQLLRLVSASTYNPIEMAAGAADLINEAGTAKVTGEEERYSNTDLVVLKANVDGAQEIVDLLRPFLQAKYPKLLAQIDQRDAAATSTVAKYTATPGYDDTGYVEYSTVLAPGRTQLARVLRAYDQALAKLSLAVTNP